jgi:hypothetical protein
MLCDMLGGSASGFYARTVRRESARVRADAALAVTLHRRFLLIDRTYGARRLWRDVRAIGWCMPETMTAQLVTHALMRAVWRRGVPRSGLAHSDQGSEVCERAVSAGAGRAGHDLPHESVWQRVGQRCHGKFLLVAQDGADRAQRARRMRRETPRAQTCLTSSSAFTIRFIRIVPYTPKGSSISMTNLLEWCF